MNTILKATGTLFLGAVFALSFVVALPATAQADCGTASCGFYMGNTSGFYDDVFYDSYDTGYYDDVFYDSYSDVGYYDDVFYDSYYDTSYYNDVFYDSYDTSYYNDVFYDSYTSPTYYSHPTTYYYSQPDYGYYVNQPYYYDNSYYSYTPPVYYPPTYNPPHYNPPRRNDDQPRCNLEASDTNVDDGDRVTLYWTAQDADHATLTGFGSVDEHSGSKTVTVTSDRTYTLRVTDNDGDSDTCSISIRVDEKKRHDNLWCEITASDRSIEDGDSVTLRWDTEGADDAHINQGIGSVDEDGGTERVRPDHDTTYRLTVENNDGDEEDCSVTIRVDDDLPSPPDEPIVFLSELPYTGTGMDAGTAMAYWLALISGAGLAGYYLFFRVMPFALAKAAREGEETSPEAPTADAPIAPSNVTRQDVRAFVSAIASRDTDSAREFASTLGPALFAEAAVVLDDVRRARTEGSVADADITSMTEGMSDEKLETLVTALADAKDVDEGVNAVTA